MTFFIFRAKNNLNLIRNSNSLAREVFGATAGSQLLGEPCRPVSDACWEAGRHARHIDPPVASSCLFTNNKSMRSSAGGGGVWAMPGLCSAQSTQTYRIKHKTHAHIECVYDITHCYGAEVLYIRRDIFSSLKSGKIYRDLNIYSFCNRPLQFTAAQADFPSLLQL